MGVSMSRAAPHGASTPTNGRKRLDLAVLIGAPFVALVLSATVLKTPPHVARMTVDNPTSYGLDIAISGPHRDGWTWLGRVEPRSATTIREVLDVGRTWVVRFFDRGNGVGDVTMSRRALQGAGWRVEVPGSVATSLATAGVPTSPCPVWGCRR
jgi:hypothetical protein